MRLVLLFTCVCLVICQIPSFDEICIHHPDAYSTNSSIAFAILNGCWRVSHNSQVVTNLSNFIITWLDPMNYLEFVFIVLFSLPFLLDAFTTSQNGKEMMSRYAFYVLELSRLMFRISLTYGITPWMYAIFRQSTPCLCQTSSDPYWWNPSLIPWGMPAGSVMTSTVLGLHFLERVGLLFGCLILFLNPLAHLGFGSNSIGQILTGITIGFFLHLYMTRTPFFMRFLEIFINFCCGVITLFIVGHFYPETDFTFCLVFFKGLVWQVFSLCPIFTLFTFKYVKTLLLKRDYLVTIEDIQYGGMSVIPDEEIAEKDNSVFRTIYNSKFFISLLIIVFLSFQMMLEILKRYMNPLFHL